MNFSDWVGTIGVGLILLAFFFSTFKIISGESMLYYGLNFAGAALACYASVLINYIPFIILEATWTLVSLVGLVRATQKVTRNYTP